MHTHNPWWRLLSGGMAATFCSSLLAGAGVAAAPASAAPKPIARVTLGGTWGTAKQVPGLAALDKGGGGDVYSISCSSAGNCGADGTYVDGAGHIQVFVANQANGTWGKAIPVPGLAALNVGGDAFSAALSCTSPGNCSAGGDYFTRSGDFTQAFVVTETNGTWGKAIEVPGIQALSTVDGGEVTALSCASPGNCSAAGHYTGSHFRQVFVVNQTNGTWGKAIPIRGTTVTKIGFAEVESVSCRAVGDCTAGGFFTARDHTGQPFVVSEKNGTWGKAIEIPGMRALNTGGSGAIRQLSCGPAGGCDAGGGYQDSHGFRQAFVVSERNGTWGKPIEVPGTAALNHQNAEVDSLSCASPGNCSASGDYRQGHTFNLEPFVVSERNGTWGKAIEVPDIESLNTGVETHVNSLSCGAAGNCSMGGDYKSLVGPQAFVVNQAHGTWG